MTRAVGVLLFLLAGAAAFAADPTAGEKDVAIIHFNQLKDGKLEGTARSLTFTPAIGTPWQTSYIELTNELLTPREVTVRILDLTEPEYDVYLNGSLAGTMKREELETGIPVSFLGTQISAAYRDYFSRLRARALDGAKRYEQAKDSEGDICRAVMQGVASWVDSIMKGDARLRTVSIIVVPTGRPLALPGGRLPDRPPDFQKSLRKLADTIQLARRTVVKRVKTTVYRFDALESITPIDFKLSASAAPASGQMVTVRAAFTNWTDRPVTGKVGLNLPTGWKARERSTTVKMRAYSKNTEVNFKVTVPEAATADVPISGVADLMVQDVLVRLQATAESK